MFKKIALIFIFFFAAACAQQAEQYELESITFEGNDELSSLEDVILSQETPWWLWKFVNSIISSLGSEPVYFDSSNIPTDIQALEDYYRANGFFESNISYRYEIDTADMEASLYYTITEGDPATYNNYNIIGLDKIDSEIYQSMLGDLNIDTTARYNQDILQMNIDNSLNNLLNNGYMNARYDSTMVFVDTMKNKIDLDIYYSAGKLYYIDTVLVDKEGEGASQVSESLLRDITGIDRGEKYNLSEIKRSQSRLFRTGLFNSVLINADQEDTLDNQVQLTLDGNIGLMNELSPEILVNNQNNALNIGLGSQYIRRNFFGNARRLSLKASFGIQEIDKALQEGIFQLIEKYSFRNTKLQGYVDTRITIEQPYLFGKPIFGTWENYANINKRRERNITKFGSKITFEFELPQYTYVNFLSTYYNIEQTNEFVIANDSLSRKLLSIIGVDVGRTTADDLLFPTRGYNLSLQVEEANSIPYLINKISGNEFDGALFYKILINGSVYWSLDPKRNSIIATKLKTGHLQSYQGDFLQIPIDRTLYAGGSNSVRGWRSNELVPLPYRGIQGLRDVGGSFLLEGSMEYRYRFLENVGTAVFFDYGNTWLGYENFRFDELALTLGVGLRYYTQIAPFRIDFGFKLYDPASKEFIFGKDYLKNFEFHFGIGEAF